MFVSGYTRVNNGNSVATYWKNGVANYLTDGSTHAGASSIIIVGSDVYVAGFVYNANGKAIATYWKNGVPVSLSPMNSEAFSIAVSGIDVYITGYVLNANSVYNAVVWKNGIVVNLTSSTAYSEANFITIISK